MIKQVKTSLIKRNEKEISFIGFIQFSYRHLTSSQCHKRFESHNAVDMSKKILQRTVNKASLFPLSRHYFPLSCEYMSSHKNLPGEFLHHVGYNCNLLTEISRLNRDWKAGGNSFPVLLIFYRFRKRDENCR